MEVIVWLKLPITQNDEVIIPRSLVGVREVGNNFVLCGPRLKVVNVARIFVAATHGVAVLDVG